MHINDVYFTERAIREVLGMVRDSDQKTNLITALEACRDTIREFEQRKLSETDSKILCRKGWN